MTDDPFAFQVERLTDRHRGRHAPSTVAEVTLQRWLILRRRYSDPFDPQLFDHIDAMLARMPASIEVPLRARPGLTESARREPGLRGRRRRSPQPISRSA